MTGNLLGLLVLFQDRSEALCFTVGSGYASLFECLGWLDYLLRLTAGFWDNLILIGLSLVDCRLFVLSGLKDIRESRPDLLRRLNVLQLNAHYVYSSVVTTKNILQPFPGSHFDLNTLFGQNVA